MSDSSCGAFYQLHRWEMAGTGPVLLQAYARKIAETELKYEKKLQDVEVRKHLFHPSVRVKLLKKGRMALTILKLW